MTNETAAEIATAPKTETATEIATPTDPSERIAGLDVLRGFALYGVFLTNAFIFSRPFDEAMQPPEVDTVAATAGAMTGATETIAWSIYDGLLVTKFVTLFSLLFGMGLVLQSQRAEAKGLPFTQIYRRRLLILAMMGIAHGCLLFEGDILFVYSIVGAILFLFRDRSPRFLLGLSLIPFAVGLLLSLGWAFFDLENLFVAIEERSAELENSTRPASFQEVLAIRPIEFLGWLLISSFISFNWRVVAFFFIGAAFMKSGWIQPRYINWQRRIGLICLVVGISLEFAGVYYTLSADHSSVGLRVTKALADEFGSVILSFGYAGIVLWTVHAGHLKLLQRGLAAVGRTALTNYLLQSVAMNIVFMEFALGFYDKLTRFEVLGWISAIFVLQIFASLLWLRYFAMGPIESVWRRLTYRRLQT